MSLHMLDEGCIKPSFLCSVFKFFHDRPPLRGIVAMKAMKLNLRAPHLHWSLPRAWEGHPRTAFSTSHVILTKPSFSIVILMAALPTPVSYLPLCQVISKRVKGFGGSSYRKGEQTRHLALCLVGCLCSPSCPGDSLPCIEMAFRNMSATHCTNLPCVMTRGAGQDDI